MADCFFCSPDYFTLKSMCRIEKTGSIQSAERNVANLLSRNKRVRCFIVVVVTWTDAEIYKARYACKQYVFPTN